MADAVDAAIIEAEVVVAVDVAEEEVVGSSMTGDHFNLGLATRSRKTLNLMSAM